MGKKKLTIVRQVLRSRAEYRIDVCIFMAMELISAMLSLLLAMLFRNVIDSVPVSEHSVFVTFISAYIVLILIQILFRAGVRHWSELSKCKIGNAIKANTLTEVLKKQLGAIVQFSSGNLISRIVDDSDTIASCFVTIAQLVISGAIKALGASFLLAYYDINIVWFLFGLFFASLAIGMFLRGKTRQYHEQAQEADAHFRSFLQEILTSLIPIRTFADERRVQERAITYLQECQEKKMLRNEITNMYLTTVNMFSQAGRIMAILWCSRMVYQRTYSIGTMLAVLQLIGLFQQSVSTVSSCISQYHMLTASEDRISLLLDIQNELYLRDEYQGLQAFRKISVKNLYFSYLAPEKRILENLSFTIDAGQFVVITGSSGVGKSTLLKLLLSLFNPLSGEITLETEDGVLQPLSAKHRGLFAYVPQRNLFLSGKVVDAITMQDEDSIDYERLNKVCQIACIDFLDDIQATLIGEAGSGYSEGQLQRIAIARALYSDAPILLLDEATSALDEATERCIWQNLSELQEKTIIAVSHRPMIFDFCDTVIKIRSTRNEG